METPAPGFGCGGMVVLDLTSRQADARPSSDDEHEARKLMPTAIVLLKIDHKKVTGTAEKLLDMRDISEVYSVSGRYDLMAIIKCDSLDKIECVITDQLLKTDGIIDSETMFAFRSYDKREGGKAIDVD
jgi:DNA-binding Lrp family transcriptional regulator